MEMMESVLKYYIKQKFYFKVIFLSVQLVVLVCTEA